MTESFVIHYDGFELSQCIVLRVKIHESKISPSGKFRLSFTSNIPILAF